MLCVTNLAIAVYPLFGIQHASSQNSTIYRILKVSFSSALLQRNCFFSIVSSKSRNVPLPNPLVLLIVIFDIQESIFVNMYFSGSITLSLYSKEIRSTFLQKSALFYLPIDNQQFRSLTLLKTFSVAFFLVLACLYSSISLCHRYDI